MAVSDRPTLLVDDRGSGVGIAPPPSNVGKPGPLGRRRVLMTLPLKNGPQYLRFPKVTEDSNGNYLADPAGALLGFAGIYVHRLVIATKTEDTRRL
jgi:hypothetical protein